MITGFLCGPGERVAEFAGVAAAMQILGSASTLRALAMLVLGARYRGTYRRLKIIFLFACILYCPTYFLHFWPSPIG